MHFLPIVVRSECLWTKRRKANQISFQFSWNLFCLFLFLFLFLLSHVSHLIFLPGGLFGVQIIPMHWIVQDFSYKSLSGNCHHWPKQSSLKALRGLSPGHGFDSPLRCPYFPKSRVSFIHPRSWRFVNQIRENYSKLSLFTTVTVLARSCLQIYSITLLIEGVTGEGPGGSLNRTTFTSGLTTIAVKYFINRY